MINFALGGCKVRLGFSWFALLAFCCLFWGGRGSAFFLPAAALHEGGHLAAMAAFGAPPAQVTCTALGCRIVPGRRKLAYGKTALVSLAGPSFNLAGAGLLFLAGWGEHPLALTNLALGMAHLLPIEPLDGGLALRAALCLWLSPGCAAWVTTVFSLALLLPLATLGFLLLLYTQYNFTLLILSLYLMLYLVLGKDLFTG